MRLSARLLLLVLLAGCVGPPPRERTVPSLQTGLVGAWRLVSAGAARLEDAGPHRRFAGLATGDLLQLSAGGRFTVLTAGSVGLTGEWLLRGHRLILRGFAASADYAYPTTATWPLVRREPDLFVAQAGPGLPVAFRRVALPRPPSR